MNITTASDNRWLRVCKASLLKNNNRHPGNSPVGVLRSSPFHAQPKVNSDGQNKDGEDHDADNHSRQRAFVVAFAQCTCVGEKEDLKNMMRKMTLPGYVNECRWISKYRESPRRFRHLKQANQKKVGPWQNKKRISRIFQDILVVFKKMLFLMVD